MDDIAKWLASLSPEKRALLVMRLKSRSARNVKNRIEPRGKSVNHVPLSFAQQRLYFFDLYQPGNPAYNVPTALRFQGHLNIDALEASLIEIICRHETLRTTFAVNGGEPFQVIAEPRLLRLAETDLGLLPDEVRESRATELAAAEARTPFDLNRGPLFRFGLLRLDRNDHLLLLTMHHIISDGESLITLMNELAGLYNAFAGGRPSALTDLPVQYADFVLWQRERFRGNSFEQQLAYWMRKLRDAPAVLTLPTDRPRPPEKSYRGATQRVDITSDIVKSLRDLSHSEHATLFMTLLAAFKVLLYRLSGMDDIVIGSGIANRTEPETEGLIGLFVNTLVLRTDLRANPTFRELLRAVREVVLDAMAHKDVPFEKIVDELRPDRDPGVNPVFQVMFSLQVVPSSAAEFSGLDVTPIEYQVGTAKSDIILGLFEMEDSVSGYFEYSEDLFDRETIVRMLDYYMHLLKEAGADPDRRLIELQMGSEESSLREAGSTVDDAFEDFDFRP